MLKLTSFALSALALISMVPAAQAAPIFNKEVFDRDRNSQPAIKVIVNPQSKNQDRHDDRDDDRYDDRRTSNYGRYNSYKNYQERQAAAQRRREWKARREAYRRYYQQKYYSNSNYHRDSYDRDDDNYYKYRDRH
jgi:hypothetical protein